MDCKQATRIDRSPKVRSTGIARRGIKVGLGTDETVSRPRPMLHSILAVTSACAASCATNQRIAPGRARTCNTATCAAYRPASAMECYLLHHGGQNGAGSPTSEEDTYKKPMACGCDPLTRSRFSQQHPKRGQLPLDSSLLPLDSYPIPGGQEVAGSSPVAPIFPIPCPSAGLCMARPICCLAVPLAFASWSAQ